MSSNLQLRALTVLHWATRFALSVCCALCVVARAQSAPTQPSKPIDIAVHATMPFTIADFDGDNHADIATVYSGQSDALQTRYWINFQLSSGPKQFLTVTGPIGGVHIAPRDVNADNFLDLVVTSEWEHRTVAVLLNDGHGHFMVRDPRAFTSAHWDAPSSSASALGHAHEIAAAMVPRNLFGDDATTRKASYALDRAARFCSLAFRPLGFAFCLSVLGRAPPIHQA
jgi:hypothetical protein